MLIQHLWNKIINITYHLSHHTQNKKVPHDFRHTGLFIVYNLRLFNLLEPTISFQHFNQFVNTC